MGTDTDRKQSSRWYDSTKMIWGMAGLVGTLLGAMSAVVYGMALRAQETNSAQDVKIERVETTMQNIERQQTRMDAKLDRILERMPK